MITAKHALWGSMLLLVLAFCGWYFASSSLPKANQQNLTDTADAIITELAVQQFDATGQLMNRLTTPSVHHFPNQDTHVFLSPYIVITSSNHLFWEIRADKAISFGKGQEIHFLHHVIIHQPQSSKNIESTFKTTKITYFPKKRFASTEAPIFFNQPNLAVTAQGMRAYLAEKRVKLLYKVRGTYAPTLP